MLEATGQEGTVMTLRKRLAQRAYRRDVETEFVLAELRHQRRVHGTETEDKRGFSSHGRSSGSGQVLGKRSPLRLIRNSARANPSTRLR
jgi:hypothetical protein